MNVKISSSKKRTRQDEKISFSKKDQGGVREPHDDAIVLSLVISTHRVKRILVDTGSFADILYLKVYKQMGYNPKNLRKIRTPFISFTSNTLQPEGITQMRIDFGTPPLVTSMMVDFLVVNAPLSYNAIIGRGTLNAIGAVISTSHLKLKFHTEKGIGEKCGHQQMARECYQLSLKGRGAEVHKIEKERHKHTSKKPQKLPDIEPNQEVVLDPKDKA